MEFAPVLLQMYRIYTLQPYCCKISFNGMISVLAKHYPADHIKKNEVGGACDTHGAYRLIVGTSEGKRPLGRPNDRRDVILKMDFKEIGSKSVDWIDLAQNKVKWRALGKH
jgi:hypothetical protein